MNLQNFIPPPKDWDQKTSFESLEGTDESLSREHWQGLIIYKSI